MTHYDVIRSASKEDMAFILAHLAAGVLGEDLSAVPELKEMLLEFLNEEAQA